MKQTKEERAIDTFGRPTADKSSMGSSKGTSKSEMTSGSAKGIGTGIGNNTVEEPIFHEASYRTGGKDKNEEKKAETGLPRQEASYQNRDRNGSGLDNNPVYQRKLPSYPKSSPKTKQSSNLDT